MTAPRHVVVIGAGPAGYVCAIRCAQLGLSTAIVEKEYLGGVCLNVGCIPSKALIAASKLVDKIQHADLMGIKAKFEGLDVGALVAWKAGIVNKLTSGVGGLLKNHKVDVLMGDARVVSKNKVEIAGKDGKKTVETKNIVIAAGSTPIEIPGFPFDGENVWSSTHALAPKQLPKSMIVIGGGVAQAAGRFLLPAVEAMACGLPIAASSRGSLPEVIGEAGVADDERASTTAMVELARRHRASLGGPVSYVLDDAQRLAGFASASFDGVTCQLALMDIPDLDATALVVSDDLEPLIASADLGPVKQVFRTGADYEARLAAAVAAGLGAFVVYATLGASPHTRNRTSAMS